MNNWDPKMKSQQELADLKTKSMKCVCSCSAHCGHSCMEEDCECTECDCPNCSPLADKKWNFNVR